MKTIFLITALALIASCKTQSYTYDQMPDKHLVFGQGGGVAGTYTNYHLLENGQVFIVNNPGNQLDSIKLKAGQARKIYKLWKAEDMQQIHAEKPGNY